MMTATTPAHTKVAPPSRTRPRGGAVWVTRALLLVVAMLGISVPVGCIQDGVVIPVALITGKIIPTGIAATTSTTMTTMSSTSTGSTTTIFTTNTVTTTINSAVPTVGVRINTVGSGTLVSIIDPIGPAPNSPEATFAAVDGTYTLPTTRLRHRRVVARGVFFDLGWGDFFPDEFNVKYTSINLKSVTIPLNSQLRTLPANHLLIKEPGRAVFILFAEDFTIRGVPVRSVRLLLDSFTNPAVGINMPDDGGNDPQLDIPDGAGFKDTASFDLSAGDGIFTRVITGLTPGQHLYAYVINDDGKIRRDPYEEWADPDNSPKRSTILVQ